jgi:hypothetical protein
MAELRSFIFLDQLQPQTMCYLGSWVRGRPPRLRMAAQVIEIAPGLDIEPLTDVALKEADVQAGILVVERQFGYLELHGTTDAVQAASSAVLASLGVRDVGVAFGSLRALPGPGRVLADVAHAVLRDRLCARRHVSIRPTLSSNRLTLTELTTRCIPMLPIPSVIEVLRFI